MNIFIRIADVTSLAHSFHDRRFFAAAHKIIPGIVKIMNAAGQMKAHEFSISDLEAPGKEQERNLKQMRLKPGLKERK